MEGRRVLVLVALESQPRRLGGAEGVGGGRDSGVGEGSGTGASTSTDGGFEEEEGTTISSAGDDATFKLSPPAPTTTAGVLKNHDPLLSFFAISGSFPDPLPPSSPSVVATVLGVDDALPSSSPTGVAPSTGVFGSVLTSPT